MEQSPCTHKAARERLGAHDPEGALRIAGAILEDNPSDLTAWRLCALGVKECGDTDGARKNLASLALALAEDRNPIAAIAAAKELEDMGADPASTVKKIAALYSKASGRVEESDLAPPPLPPGHPVEPWDEKLDGKKILSRAGDAMAMAWGAALALGERGDPLPYVPLFSALDTEEFEGLVAALKRQPADEGEQVVAQDEEGDAMYIIAEGSVAVYRTGPDGTEMELARLGPGAFVGEMALVSRAPRAASVRSLERSVLLRADRTEMEELAKRAPQVGDVLIAFCHARMLENVMRVSPVLAPVPAGRRPEVIARFGTDYRSTGDRIIEQGKEGPGLFLVVSGSVKVTREDDGEDTLLAVLGPGDLFGEISLLMRKPSTATVISAQNTALLFLPRARFEEVTANFPELLKGAYDIAVERENQNNSIMGRAVSDAANLIML